MPVVGWPPLLRVGHEFLQVSDDCAEIELGKLFGVVEIWIHRVANFWIVVQHLDVELIWPPVFVGWCHLVVGYRSGERARCGAFCC